MNTRTHPLMLAIDVRAELERASLSEHWLADRIGLPLAQLQRVLDPSNPTAFTEEEYARILRALGVPARPELAPNQEVAV